MSFSRRKERVYFPSAFLSSKTKSNLEIKDPSIVHKLRHILRKREDESIFLFDGRGREWEARIKEIRKGKIVLKKPRLIFASSSLQPKIALAFSLLKSQRNDFIFEKATELGADLFIPFIACNSQLRAISSSKFQHWLSIVKEAARQSGRLWLPEIRPCLDWKEFIRQEIGSYEYTIAFEKKGEGFFQLGKNKECKSIILVIGPEGGFSEAELADLKERGAVFIRVSSFTLRAETAAVFAVGLARILFGSDV